MTEDKINTLKKDTVDKFTHNLNYLSRRLKLVSMMVIMILILSLSFLVISTIAQYYFYVFRIFGLFISLSGIVILYYFDLTRKRGMISYDAMSDLVESFHKDIDFDITMYNSMNDIRMSMRRFLNAADLPIVPGIVGQGLYMTVFILLAIAHAFLAWV